MAQTIRDLGAAAHPHGGGLAVAEDGEGQKKSHVPICFGGELPAHPQRDLEMVIKV